MAELDNNEQQALNQEFSQEFDKIPDKVINVSRFLDKLDKIAEKKLGTMEAMVTKSVAADRVEDDTPREGLYKHPNQNGTKSLFLDTNAVRKMMLAEMSSLMHSGKIDKDSVDTSKKIVGVLVDAVNTTPDETPMVTAKVILPRFTP
jgi:hypothetical protein